MAGEENPFAPPSAEAELGIAAYDENGEPARSASQGTRFVNFIGDSVVRMGLAFGGAAALQSAGLAGMGALFSLSTLVGYYLFFEALFGRTPAKWLTGTRVVDVSGARPRFTQILGRTFARYVPFEPFSLLGTRNPVGWHDRWSHTRVVMDGR
jgi:uncharacterized RDD family membrane protein YckC